MATIQTPAGAIAEVLGRKHEMLRDIVKSPETLKRLAGYLRQAGVYIEDITTYRDIIHGFNAMLPRLPTIDDMEVFCQLFIRALRELGGTEAIQCADTLREEWRAAAKEAGYDHFIKVPLSSIITDVLKSKQAVLQVHSRESLKLWARHLRQAGMINQDVARNPTYHSIIDSFIATLSQLPTILEIEIHCQKFVDALKELGGTGAIRCADTLREEWRTVAKEAGHRFMDGQILTASVQIGIAVIPPIKLPDSSAIQEKFMMLQDKYQETVDAVVAVLLKKSLVSLKEYIVRYRKEILRADVEKCTDKESLIALVTSRCSITHCILLCLTAEYFNEKQALKHIEDYNSFLNEVYQEIKATEFSKLLLETRLQTRNLMKVDFVVEWACDIYTLKNIEAVLIGAYVNELTLYPISLRVIQGIEPQLHELQQQLETERTIKKNMAREIAIFQSQKKQAVETRDVAVQFTDLQPVSDLECSINASKNMAREIANIKKQAVETRDVAVQFTVLQPVSDTLREVTVVAEDVFTIAGDCPQVFHWEKYGFKMSVPQGSLEADETCDVGFKAIAHGQFQFPENTQLVSGVYAIAMTRKLLRPATIEVEHCVRVKNTEQCNRLSFVRAYCTQKDLPYTFKALEGGHFSPDSSVGKLSLSRFSQIAITEAVPSDSEHGYLAQLLYYQINQQPPKWVVELLVTRSIQLISEHAKQKLEKLHNGVSVQECWRKGFLFTSESRLIVKFPTIKDHKNWSCFPSRDEDELLKTDVDGFRQESADIPSCNATVVAGDHADSSFHEKVVVEGTVSPLSFNVTLTLPPQTPPSSPQVAPSTNNVPASSSQVAPSTNNVPASSSQAASPTNDSASLKGTTLVLVCSSLAQQLRKYNDRLNRLLKNENLKTFANALYSADVITTDLHDNPKYDEIEKQFTEYIGMIEKEEIEEYCITFFEALTNLGGPVKRVATKLKKEWKEKINTELHIDFNL